MLGLAACGARNPEPAPLLSITEGQYRAVVGGVCATLNFGRRDRNSYSYDADCDGQAENSGDLVVEGAVLNLGIARMDVTAVGPTSFSGRWIQDDTDFEVRFDQVPSR